MAEGGELLARRRVAQLGLVAEGEEGFVAARRQTRAGDRQHLLAREKGGPPPLRRLRECAVVTNVAAEPRERDEYLARIGDDASVAAVP